MTRSFSTRLTLALALLLLAYGAAVALLGRHLAREHEQESLQRLSHGLARHIVEHWPEIAGTTATEQATKMALMNMLMVVNPGIEVYLLDADGRVAGYIGEPGMVRRERVDLDSVRAFLGNAPLPLYGTDPKNPQGDRVRKIFSAAMFPPKAGDSRPPGYLYVVLEGQMRTQVAAPLGLEGAWKTASAVAAGALVLTLLLGALLFGRLTRPLRRLAQRMQAFSLEPQATAGAPATLPTSDRGDEVALLARRFDELTRRIGSEVQAQQQQAAAHREEMANVAHDLRTPLTALHGHLEALHEASADRRARLLYTALAQSDKVRRLVQQLFELATLSAAAQVPHPERFSLDELVADTVQKFELAAPVVLCGPPPGRVEVEGDLQLIERALANLIDNAVRHAGHAGPVKVALDVTRSAQGAQARVVIEDQGPGLPPLLADRLARGQPVREPPLPRGGASASLGGLGGLGLAIAQRIARLHGGTLSSQAVPGGGARMSLLLPAV